MGNEVMSSGQLLKQANQLKRAGRLDEAIALYYQAIEINPNFAWAYYYLAETLVKQDFQHNWDSIIAHLQKAIFLNPQSSTFHRGLERIVLNSTASWLSTTQVTQVYCSLGNALMELGEFAAASRIFAQLIEKYPSKLEGYDGAGKVAIRGCRYSQALEIYDLAISKFPGNISYLVGKGNTLMELYRYQSAEAVFQEIIAKYPDKPNGYERMAIQAMRSKRFLLALERFEIAIEKFPNVINYWVGKGNALTNLCRYEAAETLFQDLIRKYPKQRSGYEGYAKVAFHAQEWQVALERLEVALDEFPDDLNLSIHKGNVLVKLYRYQEADAVFRGLIKDRRELPDGYEGYAKCAINSQHWEVALERCQEAIDKFPGRMSLYDGKSIALMNLSKFESAIDVADFLIEKYPEHPLGYVRKKAVLFYWFQLTQSHEALVKLEEYIKFLSSLSNGSQDFLYKKLLADTFTNLFNVINSLGYTRLVCFGFIGLTVKRILNQYQANISDGELLICTFKNLVSSKLGFESRLKEAESLCRQGNLELAMEIYREIADIIIDKFMPDYSEHIHRLYSENIEHQVEKDLPLKYGSLEFARSCLEKQVSKGKSNEDDIIKCSQQLGYLLVHTNQSEAGLQHLRLALAESPYSYEANIILGYALHTLSQKKEALGYYRKSIQLSFALALLSATSLELAVEQYKFLISKKYNFLELYQSLSNLLIKKGSVDSATEIYYLAQLYFGNTYECQKIIASILEVKGKKQEALEVYDRVMSERGNSSLSNFAIEKFIEGIAEFEDKKNCVFSISDRFKITITIIGKSACSTVERTFFDLEFNIKNYPVWQEIPRRRWRRARRIEIKRQFINNTYYLKFAVIREPIKRFLSAFSNKVTFNNHDSFEKTFTQTKKYLSIAELSINPEINYLIGNLEIYQESSRNLRHHIRPQHSFIGNNLEKFDQVFQVENLGELGKKLSEIAGYEVTLPRLNTGGRKIPLKELSSESMEKLIDYYAKDYELLHEYYSPEKIWQEYQLSLSQE
jgi:tetratricopeptide (TPR) repeat protein